MLDTLSAGQKITCTIKTEPNNRDAQDTIVRLMRRDPAIAKGLRKSQTLRRQRMHSYIRGNRVWHDREKCGKIARCVRGQRWSMPFTFDLARDLASVERYLEIETA